MSTSVLFSKTLHGRKKGRPLGKDRQAAISDILPLVSISKDHLEQKHTQHPKSFFPAECKEYWLEIGFGQGEHLAGRSSQNPNTGYFGAEPFINGVAGLMQKIEHLPKNRIKIFHGDGMILARSLKIDSIDGIFILNPDPWHKKRHYKRRLIQPENLDIFANILKPGGKLIITTDVPDLTDWMITHTVRHPNFEWSANSASDWSTAPSNWISTRYEQKGAKGAKKMAYMIFTKKHI